MFCCFVLCCFVLFCFVSFSDFVCAPSSDFFFVSFFVFFLVWVSGFFGNV